MAEDKQPIIDEYHRQVEAILKQAGITADRILSHAKLRINANEKLILLASGVLTLTFSGAISLYSRPGFQLSSQALRLLLGAWKLLIAAIVCCIIANSREGRAASVHDSDLQASEAWARTALLKMIGNQWKPDPLMELESAPKPKKVGDVHEKIAGFFGWLARISVVGAFLLLYVFVRSVIVQL